MAGGRSVGVFVGGAEKCQTLLTTRADKCVKAKKRMSTGKHRSLRAADKYADK
jgi:hypothetical protein